MYPDDVVRTLIVSESVICPKCKRDVSKQRFAIKENDLLWKIFTINMCWLSGIDFLQHLKGVHMIKKEEYDVMNKLDMTKPLLVKNFNELRGNV